MKKKQLTGIEEFLNDNENVVNMDNATLLARDNFEELSIKAIIILLTEMKLKSTQLKQMIADGNTDDTSSAVRELEDLEEEYRFFELNMDDALTDPLLAESVRERAREVLIRHL